MEIVYMPHNCLDEIDFELYVIAAMFNHKVVSLMYSTDQFQNCLPIFTRYTVLTHIQLLCNAIVGISF